MKQLLKEIYAANDCYRQQGTVKKQKRFDDHAKCEAYTKEEKEQIIKRALELEAQGIQMIF